MKRLCRIREIQHTITNIEHSFHEQYGICFNEAALLCALEQEEKPLSSGEISNILELSHSNTSKIISSAEKKGYLIRELGCEDRRHMYFILTEKGRELIRSIDCSKMEIPSI